MRAAVDGPPQPLHEIVAGRAARARDDHRQGARARRRAAATRTPARSPRSCSASSPVSSSRRTTTRRGRSCSAVRAQEPRARDGRGAARRSRSLVGGTIAIKRIVDERDRADESGARRARAEAVAEAEKQKVLDGYQQLTLAEARHRADDDPTRAAAMVRPLLVGTQWRERARRDRGGARARHRVRACRRRRTRCRSRRATTATHLLAAGDDGIVRIHDLAQPHDARGRRRQGARRGAVRRRRAQDRAVRRRDRVTIVDAATGDAPRDRRTGRRHRARGRGADRVLDRPARARCGSSTSPAARRCRSRSTSRCTRSRRRPTAGGSRSPAATHLLLLDRTHASDPARERHDRRDARARVVGRLARPRRAGRRRARPRPLSRTSPTSCGRATSAAAPRSRRQRRPYLQRRADRRRSCARKRTARRSPAATRSALRGRAAAR